MAEYIAAFRRRKLHFWIPLGVIFVVGIILAFTIPPVYRSSATIQIVQQSIPKEFVQSTITTYADQRIAEISQQILSTNNLLKLIRTHGLYTEEGKTKTNEEIIETMRENISREMLSADVIDPKSGRPTKATIAFRISFDHRAPSIAQKITGELVDLYRSFNIKTRAEKAAETTEFLHKESERLNAEITKLEKMLSVFKQKNLGQLPEMTALNTQMMDRAESELKEAQRQLRTLEERRIYLQGQLGQIDPYAASGTGSQKALSSRERLKALRTQYVSASATYSPTHPDVIRAKREIDALEREVGGTHSGGELAQQLSEKKNELITLREKYSATHPDVKKLERNVASLAAAVKQERRTKRRDAVGAGQPDNPAYIQLQTQLEVTSGEIKATRSSLSLIQTRIHGYEKRLASTPEVEREYRELSRDYSNALTKYRDIKSKLDSARLGESLEKGNQSEQLEIIDAPMFPEKPFKPNRIAIVLLTILASLAGGIGSVFLFEAMDKSVRGYRAVTLLMGAPPLAIIPLLQDPLDLGKVRQRRWVIFGVVTGMLFIVLLFIHLRYELDVFWYSLLRRFGI